MSGLGQSILEEGFEKGKAEGIEQGIERGIEQGVEQGIEQGIMLRNISLARKKFAKNIPLEECADMLETDVGLVQKIYTALQEHPDWDDEQIYTALFKQG